MTQTNTTPTGDTNQTPENTKPIDNMGNPVNPDGTPREPEAAEDKPTENEGGESVESLQKALKDTKAELTRIQQDKADTDTEPKDTEPQPNTTPEDLQIQEKKAVEAGIDMSKYSDQYNADGELSDDSYKELSDKGLDKETVDA